MKRPWKGSFGRSVSLESFLWRWHCTGRLSVSYSGSPTHDKKSGGEAVLSVSLQLFAAFPDESRREMTAVPWVGLGNPPLAPRQVFLVKVASGGFSWMCRGVECMYDENLPSCKVCFSWGRRLGQ